MSIVLAYPTHPTFRQKDSLAYLEDSELMNH